MHPKRSKGFDPLPIRCLLTGGTIDNCYHQRKGKMVIGANVEKMLRTLRLPHHRIAVSRLFKIDSRDMNDEHRARIISEIRGSREDKIIITHGTDTMVETGRYLISVLGKHRKTVVLTGAMVPYGVTGGTPSGKGEDALANLTSAITMMETLPPGVWIIFHGRKLDPRKAYKDYERLTILEK